MTNGPRGGRLTAGGLDAEFEAAAADTVPVPYTLTPKAEALLTEAELELEAGL